MCYKRTTLLMDFFNVYVLIIAHKSCSIVPPKSWCLFNWTLIILRGAVVPYAAKHLLVTWGMAGYCRCCSWKNYCLKFWFSELFGKSKLKLKIKWCNVTKVRFIPLFDPDWLQELTLFTFSNALDAVASSISAFFKVHLCHYALF